MKIDTFLGLIIRQNDIFTDCFVFLLVYNFHNASFDL